MKKMTFLWSSARKIGGRAIQNRKILNADIFYESWILCGLYDNL